VVGANEDNENGDYAGSVYIFRHEDVNWIQQVKLLAPDGSPGDRFGSSVSINSNYVIIGSPKDDDDIGGTDCGSVYVFKNNGTGWTQQKRLTALDADIVNNFGCSVSIGGDYVIIGAEGDNDNGHNSGSAYIYRFADITGI